MIYGGHHHFIQNKTDYMKCCREEKNPMANKQMNERKKTHAQNSNDIGKHLSLGASKSWNGLSMFVSVFVCARATEKEKMWDLCMNLVHGPFMKGNKAEQSNNTYDRTYTTHITTM